MYRDKVGIIGGFGAYATLNFYKRILEQFASDSERNYPHIFMDNDFTMPSRTRALLYGEEYSAVVDGIAASMDKMCRLGADYIILVCGTAHAFLPDVYKLVPEAEKKVLDIINITRSKLLNESVNQVLVIAAEGTLKHEIYTKRFEKYGIKCENPQEECYAEIRMFIESVKRNKMDAETAKAFMDFLGRFGIKDIILGCTEFPILVDYISESGTKEGEELKRYRFWDPLEVTIEELKNRLK